MLNSYYSNNEIVCSIINVDSPPVTSSSPSIVVSSSSETELSEDSSDSSAESHYASLLHDTKYWAPTKPQTLFSDALHDLLFHISDNGGHGINALQGPEFDFVVLNFTEYFPRTKDYYVDSLLMTFCHLTGINIRSMYYKLYSRGSFLYHELVTNYQAMLKDRLLLKSAAFSYLSDPGVISYLVNLRICIENYVFCSFKATKKKKKKIKPIDVLFESICTITRELIVPRGISKFQIINSLINCSYFEDYKEFNVDEYDVSSDFDMDLNG
ncbi:hypothetical protein P9112_000253 [Eukaryota sp. TZLM1-RC]